MRFMEKLLINWPQYLQLVVESLSNGFGINETLFYLFIYLFLYMIEILI